MQARDTVGGMVFDERDDARTPFNALPRAGPLWADDISILARDRDNGLVGR